MPSKEISFQKNVYTYADLSTFGGHYSFASAINNSGEMVGNDTRNESDSAQILGTQTT